MLWITGVLFRVTIRHCHIVLLWWLSLIRTMSSNFHVSHFFYLHAAAWFWMTVHPERKCWKLINYCSIFIFPHFAGGMEWLLYKWTCSFFQSLIHYFNVTLFFATTGRNFKLVFFSSCYIQFQTVGPQFFVRCLYYNHVGRDGWHPLEIFVLSLLLLHSTWLYL